MDSQSHSPKAHDILADIDATTHLVG